MPDVTADHTPATGAFTAIAVQAPVDALLNEADAVLDPDFERCPAATGHAVHPDGQCSVHGPSHRCYRAPSHQASHRDSQPIVRAKSPETVPEWATHVCDCGFAWANIVQERHPAAASTSWPAQKEITQ